MVGDASVIPAIAASLKRIPAGVPVHVLIEVEDAADEQPLETPGDLHLQWLPVGATVDALRDLEFPDGAVHALVHGEATTVREVRRHLLVDRELPREALSVSGYWKRLAHRRGLARGQGRVEPPGGGGRGLAGADPGELDATADR